MMTCVGGGTRGLEAEPQTPESSKFNPFELGLELGRAIRKVCVVCVCVRVFWES